MLCHATVADEPRSRHRLSHNHVSPQDALEISPSYYSRRWARMQPCEQNGFFWSRDFPFSFLFACLLAWTNLYDHNLDLGRWGFEFWLPPVY